jgi:acyl-CoA thioesterase YciA
MTEIPAIAEYTLSILVMPAQENTLGVMHGGHLMSWMDMAAWVVAARAVESDQTVLFKAVEDLVWSAPLHAGDVCSVTARLIAVGKTSLRVSLEALGEDPARNTTWLACRANFTMVTVGGSGTSEPVRLLQ